MQFETQTETELAAIWREALEIESFDRDASFLALGGSSMQMMVLALRLREKFGIEPTLQDLLAAPTLAGMAAWIDLARRVLQQPGDSRGTVGQDGDAPEAEGVL